MWGFIISVPKILESDQNDPGDIIFQLFPTVEVVDYSSHRFYRLRRRYDIPFDGSDVFVNVEGDPIEENCESNSRSVACIGVIGRDIYGLDTGASSLDFIVSGRLKYGERILDGIERKWVETMTDVIPDFQLVGRVDSMHDKDITFVFMTELSDVKCLRGGGRLALLTNFSSLRYCFRYSLHMIKYFLFWNISIDLSYKIGSRRIILGRHFKCNKKREKILISKSEIEDEVAGLMADVLYHRNGNWVHMSEIKNVVMSDVHVVIKRDVLVEKYCTSRYLLPGVRFYELTGDKLVYVVEDSFIGSTSIVSLNRSVTVYSYVDPWSLIQDMYGVSRLQAVVMLRNCSGRIPIFRKVAGALNIAN